jgi:hypothetical protein
MSETITCPSGLKGSIRAMLVREERILADRKLAKAGGQVVCKLDVFLAARVGIWTRRIKAGNVFRLRIRATSVHAGRWPVASRVAAGGRPQKRQTQSLRPHRSQPADRPLTAIRVR